MMTFGVGEIIGGGLFILALIGLAVLKVLEIYWMSSDKKDDD